MPNTVFSGSFPEIKTHISHSHSGAGAPGDFTIDPHGTVVGGMLNEVAAHPEIQALFQSWGMKPGAKLDTSASGADEMFMRQHRISEGGASLIAILWDEGKRLGFWGVETDTGFDPAPNPTQPPASFKGEVEKALRLAGTEFHEAIMQARADGVATAEQETEFLKRRLALLVALNVQVQALPDAVNPGEPIAPNGQGQAECDALWDYIAEIRESFVRQRMTGYTVDPYWAAQGNTSYFKSVIDTHLFNGLNAMSNVALVLGLRGRWIMVSLFGAPPRPIRDAYYVSPFQSWASQDDVMRKFAGVPDGQNGLHLGGQ